MLILSFAIVYLIGAIAGNRLGKRRICAAFPMLPWDGFDIGMNFFLNTLLWPVALPICYLMFKPYKGERWWE